MKKLLLLLFCVILITGCNLIPVQPYIQTYYFDIGSPDTNIGKNNTNVQIMTVNESGPYRARMFFRTSPTSVRFDEFNRWSMEPTEMIKRYMLMVYDSGNEINPKNQKKYGLNAELTQLEADLQNNKINLTIRFELYETQSENNLWIKTFRQQIPAQKITGESYAQAVKFGMDNIIKELDMNIDGTAK